MDGPSDEYPKRNRWHITIWLVTLANSGYLNTVVIKISNYNILNIIMLFLNVRGSIFIY
jgi:hypothetical protein